MEAVYEAMFGVELHGPHAGAVRMLEFTGGPTGRKRLRPGSTRQHGRSSVAGVALRCAVLVPVIVRQGQGGVRAREDPCARSVVVHMEGDANFVLSTVHDVHHQMSAGDDCVSLRSQSGPPCVGRSAVSPHFLPEGSLTGPSVRAGRPIVPAARQSRQDENYESTERASASHSIHRVTSCRIRHHGTDRYRRGHAASFSRTGMHVNWCACHGHLAPSFCHASRTLPPVTSGRGPPRVTRVGTDRVSETELMA